MLRRAAVPPSGSLALGRLTMAELAMFFVIAAGLDLLLGFQTFSPVLQGDLISPDSYMRLVRIREGLAHGGLFRPSLQQIVSADGSGWGTVLHWTRFFDGVLLALAAPLTPVLGQDAALHLAGAAIGPIGMGLLGMATAWAAAPVADRHWLWTAPLLVGLSNVLDSYGVFGYADHHILLVVAVVATLGAAGRAAHGDRRAGATAGIAAAIGLWISPETMPFDLMGFAAMVIGWSMRPILVGPALRRAAGTLLMVTGAAFLLDPPLAGYRAAEIDRLSLVYVVMAVLLFGVTLLLAPVERREIRRLPVRLLLGAVLGGVAFACWIGLFPAVLGGPDGLMPPEVRAVFFDRIEEMQPARGLAEFALYLGTGMLATLAALFQAYRTRSPLWLFAGAGGAATVLIGAVHIRFATYSAGLGAVMLPVVVTLAGRWAAGRPAAALPGLVRVAVLALFLLVPMLPTGLAKPAEAAAGKEGGLHPTCALGSLGRMLAPYAGQIVLTSANETPEVLYRAPVKTVGSLYHRNIDGFLRQRAAWITRPTDSATAGTVPSAVLATGATLILACPDPAKPLVDGDDPADTLVNRLGRAEVPAWLEPVAADAASGLRLYRIKSPAK